MARPLRIDHPDTFYHVLSRGNEKKEIFRDEQDHYKFLELLARMVERFQLEIHAYVLMKNHYHLLIHTKEGNLSRAIQWLGVSYSVWFNRRHQRIGHLFQGRFKSFLIEDERYFTAVCLYIHGNPLRACLINHILDYKWSSYQGYVDERREASWLTTELVLGMYGGSRGKFRQAQELSLEKGSGPLGDLRHGLYLGSEDYSQDCIERIKGEGRQEKPQARSLLKSRDIRALTVRILNELGEKDPESVLKVRKYRCQNRDIAIYILYRVGVYLNAEIGNVFGVGYTAIPGAVKRGQDYLEADGELERVVKEIIGDI